MCGSSTCRAHTRWRLGESEASCEEAGAITMTTIAMNASSRTFAAADTQCAEIGLRPGTPDDAGPAGTICYEAFKTIAEQHGFAPDFPSSDDTTDLISHLLSRSDIHAVIAERDGRVVGSNFLWEGDAVAGVGPITVDPSVQNRAVGRQLMEAVLERARQQGISSVRLVQAAYHARSLSLYTKLGFVVREPLAVLQGQPSGLPVNGRAVRTATEADLDAAHELCRRVHGYDRVSALRDAIGQGTATVVEDDGRITGYASEIGFLGHAVGETTDDLTALIAAAPSFSGPGFLVPMRNAELFRWCLEQGLAGCAADDADERWTIPGAAGRIPPIRAVLGRVLIWGLLRRGQLCFRGGQR
jgi:GNAT superfamily N-acetyltransferase